MGCWGSSSSIISFCGWDFGVLPSILVFYVLFHFLFDRKEFIIARVVVWWYKVHSFSSGYYARFGKPTWALYRLGDMNLKDCHSKGYSAAHNYFIK